MIKMHVLNKLSVNKLILRIRKSQDRKAFLTMLSKYCVGAYQQFRKFQTLSFIQSLKSELYLGAEFYFVTLQNIFAN